MKYEEEFHGDPSIEEINQVLQGLVFAGMVEMGVNDEGEFIFWMTDEQKDAIIEKMEEYRDYE